MSTLTDVCASSIISSLGYPKVGIFAMVHVREVGMLADILMDRGRTDLLAKMDISKQQAVASGIYSEGRVVRDESDTTFVIFIKNRPGYIVTTSSAVDACGAPFIEQAVLRDVFSPKEIAGLVESAVLSEYCGILYQYEVQRDWTPRTEVRVSGLEQYIRSLSGKITDQAADILRRVYVRDHTYRPIKSGSQSRVRHLLHIPDIDNAVEYIMGLSAAFPDPEPVEFGLPAKCSKPRHNYVVDGKNVSMTVFDGEEYLCVDDFSDREIADMISRGIVDARICLGYEFIQLEDLDLDIF